MMLRRKIDSAQEGVEQNLLPVIEFEEEAMTEQRRLEYTVGVERLDEYGSVARCKEAEVILDTGLPGRSDAFNPAELLLTALAACMVKGIERVTPMLKFEYRHLQIRLHGIRQDAPPMMSQISYEIQIDTDESDHRLELLHGNVKKYGTVFNTVARGTSLTGTIRRT